MDHARTTKSRFYKITYRLAGNFELRVFFHGASAGGPPRHLVSPVKPVEVRFPSSNEIATNQAVGKFTRERVGTHVAPRDAEVAVGGRFLDIAAYMLGNIRPSTARVKGPATDQTSRAEDNPRAAASGHNEQTGPGEGLCHLPGRIVSYTYATRYLGSPRKVGQPCGPRGRQRHEDAGNRFRLRASPPGSGHIPNGYPKHEPAKPYRAGLFLRPTP